LLRLVVRFYNLVISQNNEIKDLYRAGNQIKEDSELINRYIGKECRKAIQSYFMTAEQVKETKDRLYTFELDKQYEGLVANKPVYATVYEVRDSIFLFDFNNYSILKFNQDGSQIGETPMQIVFNRDWKNKMHKDPVTGRFFLEFLNGQSTYLIEIDPYTGVEIQKIPIREYKHIDHVSIVNSRVFFLHQPDFGNRGKKLFYIDI